MSDNQSQLYPLLFEPVLKSYVWGGRNLETRLGRELPPGVVAESWEIAAHADGTAVVVNGPFAGLSLTVVHDRLGLDLIGRRNSWAQDRGKFPLLIKLIDADDKLSIQVHPSDEYAQAHESGELGKTEMWVVLHAEPGAELIVGLRAGTNPDTLRGAVENGDLDKWMHRLPVQKGDFVCVPSGTVHAILGGVIIAEIQQNSNVTYRLFDWNRSDDGNPRPLHIDKAMEVIDFGRVEPPLPKAVLIAESNGVRRSLLCHNSYFTTERVKLSADAVFAGELDGQTLEIWGVLEGQVEVNTVAVSAVRFMLLPAAIGPYEVRAGSAGAVCLRVYVDHS